jgi:hypothetical protein
MKPPLILKRASASVTGSFVPCDVLPRQLRSSGLAINAEYRPTDALLGFPFASDLGLRGKR